MTPSVARNWATVCERIDGPRSLWIVNWSRRIPKAKLLGAINYMLNRWDSFERFLESGCIPLRNNVAERALKHPILGRKAWLVVGNPTAGETAAKLITLTKTCNRLHIDPFAYLQDVYARLPTMSPHELPSLLPDLCAPVPFAIPQQQTPVSTSGTGVRQGFLASQSRIAKH